MCARWTEAPLLILNDVWDMCLIEAYGNEERVPEKMRGQEG